MNIAIHDSESTSFIMLYAMMQIVKDSECVCCNNDRDHFHIVFDVMRHLLRWALTMRSSWGREESAWLTSSTLASTVGSGVITMLTPVHT
jgi:hypothetical protein